MSLPDTIALKQKIGETNQPDSLPRESWEAFDRLKKKKIVVRRYSTADEPAVAALQAALNAWEKVRKDGVALLSIEQQGQDEQGFWYSREFAAGKSLLESYSAGTKAAPLKEPFAVKKILDLSAFVAKLHDNGLAHGNLKASNVFETEGGILAVPDFLPDFQEHRTKNDIQALAQLLAFLLNDVNGTACSSLIEAINTGQIPLINEFRKSLTQIGKAVRSSAFGEPDIQVPPQNAPKDAAPSAPEQVPPGTLCPQCRAPIVSLQQRVCPQCSRPYFEPCLNCQALHPVWEKQCRSCGGDVVALKQNMYATLNTQKQQILKYRQTYGHDKTLPLLKYMSTVNHPDFLAFREWAKSMTLLIAKERKDIKIYVDNIRSQIDAAMSSQKYDRVRTIIEQIPRQLLDDQIRQIYIDAGDAMTEVESLVKEIRNALSAKQYSTLLSCVQRYLELKANDPEAQNLQKKIEKLTTITTPKDMKLRRIPGGKFYMGSHDSDEFLRNNEHPQHRVLISRNLFVGVYPVTQKQFSELMEFNPSTSVENELCPADCVTWFSAVEFCNKMSDLESLPAFYELTAVKRRQNGSIERAGVKVNGGDGYRLLTEAEWEYACRAGTITPWSFGDLLSDVEKHAWFYDNSGGETHIVGLKKANPWGLLDMHGNVMEWCHDWYSDSFYGLCGDEEENPTGPEEGTARVLRGGAWQFGAEATRCAYRNSSTPDTAVPIIGFRVCRNANDAVM